MCLAIPGRVIGVERENELVVGRVDFGGVIKKVCLEYVPETAPGDYVLVHVGFALSRIDADEAARLFATLAELGAIEEELA
jgi:hydrogenase expression/formation protein HypC